MLRASALPDSRSHGSLESGCIDWLDDHSRVIPDVRIAESGLESLVLFLDPLV